jgi:hypothetical protein
MTRHIGRFTDVDTPLSRVARLVAGHTSSPQMAFSFAWPRVAHDFDLCQDHHGVAGSRSLR